MKTIISAIAFASVCLGCSVLEPTVDNTRFYVLSAGLPAPLERVSEEKLSIGLGPVYLPAYLDSPWIAVRKSEVEIDYAESHQWGETLEQGIHRVLRDNLKALLGTHDITIMRQARRSEGRYVIVLDFSRFEMTESGEAVVKVAWRISNGPVEGPERKGEFETSIAFDKVGEEHSAGAEALGQALAGLSRQLAAVLSEN